MVFTLYNNEFILGNMAPVLQVRYSVFIFSYSGPIGILGSDGTQNTVLVGARGREY